MNDAMITYIKEKYEELLLEAEEAFQGDYKWSDNTEVCYERNDEWDEQEFKMLLEEYGNKVVKVLKRNQPKMYVELKIRKHEIHLMWELDVENPFEPYDLWDDESEC